MRKDGTDIIPHESFCDESGRVGGIRRINLEKVKCRSVGSLELRPLRCPPQSLHNTPGANAIEVLTKISDHFRTAMMFLKLE
jgi:hypothetical protein